MRDARCGSSRSPTSSSASSSSCSLSSRIHPIRGSCHAARPGPTGCSRGTVYDGLADRLHHPTLAITWSLAIEEHYYLLWPLIVARCPPRRLGALCLAIASASFVLRVIAVALDAGVVTTHFVTPLRLEAIALGSFVAVRTERDGGFASLARINRVLYPAAALATTLLVAVLVADPGGLMARDRHGFVEHPLTRTLGLTLVAILGAALLVRAMSGQRGAFHRVLESSAFRQLGTISFAVYLVHIPITQALFTWGVEVHARFLPEAIVQIAFFAAVLVTSVAVGGLSWWAFESRVLSLRRLFPFRRCP